MSKIVVEDLTEPPDSSEIVEILAGSFFLNATYGGLKMGVSFKEVTEALMRCAEFTAQYAKALGSLDDSDIHTFRMNAITKASERLKQLQESGFVDAIKKGSEEVALARCAARNKKEGDNES